jgi:hypothetical protein
MPAELYMANLKVLDDNARSPGTHYTPGISRRTLFLVSAKSGYGKQQPR